MTKDDLIKQLEAEGKDFANERACKVIDAIDAVKYMLEIGGKKMDEEPDLMKSLSAPALNAMDSIMLYYRIVEGFEALGVDRNLKYKY